MLGCGYTKVQFLPSIASNGPGGFSSEDAQRALLKFEPTRVRSLPPLQPAFPVIDVHTHMFDGRELPLEGILAGRIHEFTGIENNATAAVGVTLVNALRYGAKLVPTPLVTQISGRPITEASLRKRVDMLATAAATLDSANDADRHSEMMAMAKLKHRWFSSRSMEDDLNGVRPEDTPDTLTDKVIAELRHKHRWEPTPEEITWTREKRLRDCLCAMIYLGARQAMKENKHVFDDDPGFWAMTHGYGLFLPDHLVQNGIANIFSRDVKNMLYWIEWAVHDNRETGVLSSMQMEKGNRHLDTTRPPLRLPGGAVFPPLWQAPALRSDVHLASMTSDESILWFALNLFRGATQMQSVHQAQCPATDLAMAQNMNMEPTYNQFAGPVSSLPGVPSAKLLGYKTQVENSKTMATQAAGRMGFFVAYTPFDSIEDTRSAADIRACSLDDPQHFPKALKVVDDAMKKGAWGVKFYPPQGYRPTDNAIDHSQDRFSDPFAAPADVGRTYSVPDPSPFDRAAFYAGNWRSAPRQQWQQRYERPGWCAEKMDALNDLLFRYCERHQVPIFTHCNTGEMRAEGRSNLFAGPQFWRLVLNQHHNLRLCLGHAGGAAFWYGLPMAFSDSKKPKADGKLEIATHDRPDWGLEVARLCVEFPNVYADLGIHDEMADPGHAARFAVVLDELLHHPDSRLARLMNRDRGHYPLSQKLVYGTDWFMPVTETPNTYFAGFLHVFDLKINERAVFTLPEQRAFFAGNAAQFLRLDHQITSNPLVLSNPAAVAYLSQLSARIKNGH